MAKVDPMATTNTGALTNEAAHKFKDGASVTYKGESFTVQSFFNGLYTLQAQDGTSRYNVTEAELTAP